MNIIEHTWDYLNRRVQTWSPLPCNHDKMWIALQEEWERLEDNFIKGLFQRITLLSFYTAKFFQSNWLGLNTEWVGGFKDPQDADKLCWWGGACRSLQCIMWCITFSGYCIIPDDFFPLKLDPFSGSGSASHAGPEKGIMLYFYQLFSWVL